MKTVAEWRGSLIRSIVATIAPGLVLGLCLLAGCSAPPKKRRYIWPIPPQQARLEYLSTIYRPEDLELESDSFKKALLGQQEPIFQTPFDLLIDKQGSLVISDTRAGVLWTLSAKGKLGTLPVAGQHLGSPLGIACDATGRIFVAEAKKRRIAVISPEGKVERTIGEGIFEANPTFLAIDRKRKLLYASESRRHRIQVFSCDGRHLRTLGTPGVKPGQLAGPQGIAVNPKGELIVADMLNARLSVFSPSGDFARVIPFNGWGPYYFSAPKGVAVGPDGKIWVTDQRIGALVAYSAAEEPEMVLGAGRMSAHPMAFVAPAGLDISQQGSLWIADILMRRLSHWQQLTPEYLASHPFDAATIKRLRKFGQGSSLQKKEHSLH